MIDSKTCRQQGKGFLFGYINLEMKNVHETKGICWIGIKRHEMDIMESRNQLVELKPTHQWVALKSSIARTHVPTKHRRVVQLFAPCPSAQLSWVAHKCWVRTKDKKKEKKWKPKITLKLFSYYIILINKIYKILNKWSKYTINIQLAFVFMNNLYVSIINNLIRKKNNKSHFYFKNNNFSYLFNIKKLNLKF